MKSEDEKKRAIEQRHQAGLISATQADLQEKLNVMVSYVLKEFVGKDLTPTLIAEAEGQLRKGLEDLVRAGVYKLPPNMEVDRVELGEDMRIKVYFKRSF